MRIYEKQSKFAGDSGTWYFLNPRTDHGRLCIVNHSIPDCVWCSGDHPDWSVSIFVWHKMGINRRRAVLWNPSVYFDKCIRNGRCNFNRCSDRLLYRCLSGKDCTGKGSCSRRDGSQPACWYSVCCIWSCWYACSRAWYPFLISCTRRCESFSSDYCTRNYDFAIHY